MTSQYRRLLRERAAVSDAAFAEYMSDLVFPEHLRAASRFAQGHERGIILAPRGHAKTTLFLYRAARLIGAAEGRCRLGILTAVDADAESRSRGIRDIVESLRFGEVFGWAQGGVEGCGLEHPRRRSRQGLHLSRDESRFGPRRGAPR